MSDDLGKILSDLRIDKLSPEERERVLREVRATVSSAVEKEKESKTSPEAVLEAAKPVEEKKEEVQFERFTLLFRIQHMLLFTSCIILIITGIPLKFAGTGWADFYFQLTGGLPVNRIIHRIGATGLIIVGVFHVLYIIFTKDGWKNFLALLPRPKDFVDVFNNMKYFLGFSPRPAQFARFSYIEKFDYWAVYWGNVVMIGSGLMLWFTDISLKIMPKYALDMATEAHSDEALLATLAIIIWHFYNVHFNPDHFPMNPAWWTGKISEEDIKHHHPLEYEEIMKERAALKSAECAMEEGVSVKEKSEESVQKRPEPEK